MIDERGKILLFEMARIIVEIIVDADDFVSGRE